MTQIDKALRFAELHVQGEPLLLYNAWDAGSAKAVAAAGAAAIATGSWSVAEAQGYRDGEEIPLDLAERIYARIVATVEVPVTVDFEGGYSADEGELSENISRLLDLGVVGVNFEDRVVKGTGLYDVVRQARRITVLRKAAEQKGIPLFINARTDLFLGKNRGPGSTISGALERAGAYEAAGASGFFIPGLLEEEGIGEICARVRLPVNVLVKEGVPAPHRLAELGVSRISYGPLPYFRAMEAVQREAALAAASLLVGRGERQDAPVGQ